MPPRAKARGSKASLNDARKPSRTKAYKIPPPLPRGEILTDVKKKPWKIGPGIGQGGFGLIYLASDDTSHSVGSDAEYVMKVEPISNGPLFCELHFYQRAAKAETIEDFRQNRKLNYVGIPNYVTTGQHSHNGVDYRFLVMHRFGTDLQKIFESSGKLFSKKTVFCLGLRLLDALEYMHTNDYVHADIKAANILLGCKRGCVNPNEVYLVDFGLAYRYHVDGKHKDYKEDPRRVHDGTIEFTSRDAHRGVVPARRGDLEILGYCLLQWLCSRLPWEDNLEDKDYVSDSKHRYMDNVDLLMKTCFPAGDGPAELKQYLKYVSALKYAEKPDYNKLRKMLRTGLGKKGDEWTLDLDVNSTRQKPIEQKKARKRKSSENPGSSQPKVAKESPQDVQEPLTPAMRERLAKMRNGSSLSLPKSLACDSAAVGASGRSSSNNSLGSQRARKAGRIALVQAGETDQDVSKASTSCSTGRRRVKRTKAVTTDMAVQTSPAIGRKRR
ncbi:serine/threonine-protein kinase VRK1-like [Liolophura sinensis]|uniref:serine/threonine-protein kinase VRK1-like n=1 Tax=Liolophura sinensis TaxID=3198878 RepID=UPI0031583F7E